MYELLTGRQAFPADNFSQLVNKILNEVPVIMSDHRSDLPDALNSIVAKAINKELSNRYQMGLDFAADLTKAFDNLEKPKEDISAQEKFDAVKRLEFFNGFPDAEIWEILRASTWQDYDINDDIIVEGDMDDCFYIITNGNVEVMKNESVIRTLQQGDCFGEMGYLAKTKRTASIKAGDNTSLMKINSTVISQVSLNCQVRFADINLSIVSDNRKNITGNIVTSHFNRIICFAVAKCMQYSVY